jgi:flavin-dependent dehydrogenase
MKMIKTIRNTEVDYEIMIVGGGPAGISTWLHLHKYAPELAEKTVLIEKEKYPRDKVCGGALGGWTETILEHLKLEVNVPSVSIHTVECRLGKDIYQHKQRNFFRIVRRIEFDHAIAKTAVNRGLKLYENEIFMNVLRKTNYLVIKTNKREYKVRVLIGADGSLSRVRHSMNPLKKPRLTPAIEIFSPVDPKYDPEFFKNTATIDFSPVTEGLHGYVWHFPCLYENQPFMNHGIDDFRIYHNKQRANLKKIFTRELQARNIHINHKYWSSHPISILEEDCTLSQPNILLVGDAAGIDSAISGGIHLAFSYGELAAQTINEAFENNDFSFNDYKIRFQNHLVGKYIRKLNHLAKEMYENRMNPLEVSKIIFSKKPN